MPEEATDYDVSDGLPEDQEEDEVGVLTCLCGAEIQVIAGSASDVMLVARVSGWEFRESKEMNGVLLSICPRCQ